MGVPPMPRREEFASLMELRRSDAAMRDVTNKLGKEVLALHMAQRRSESDAALRDVQIKIRREAFALHMAQR
jgi:Mg2+ and Co2+ transporter CorA